MSRGANAAERAEFAAAHATVNAQLNPKPENVHLEALKFVSSTVRDHAANGGTLYESEAAQYVAVYDVRKRAIGRPLRNLEADILRRASRAFWSACESSPPVWKQLLSTSGR